MSVKSISIFCFVLCLMSCTRQPKYAYAIQATSNSIEDSTLERLKQRLQTITGTGEVRVTKENDTDISINFKSSAIDSIVRDIITTKGNLSFYETKKYIDIYQVTDTLHKMISSDTVYLENAFLPSVYSSDIGTVDVRDTIIFNKLLNTSEINHILHKEKLRIKFAWGTRNPGTSLVPLYALDIGVKRQPAMYGNIISQVKAGRNQIGRPSILISMEGLQAEKWERLTRRAAEANTAIAIVIDGTVVMAPVVSQAIQGGKAEISGNLKEREVFALAVILESGPIQQLEIVQFDKQVL